MDDLSERISDWVQAHPQYGYLIAAGLLLFWLLGVIRGWKWTYESNTWKENTFRKMLGEKSYRIGLGVLLGMALAASLYLFFSPACRNNIKEDQTGQCQILETFMYCLEGSKITATDSTAIVECSGIHKYYIEPFFEDLARRQGKKPERITVTGYCNTHRHLLLSDSLLGDTIRQTFRVTVDILSPGQYNNTFSECVNSLRDKDFIPIDVVSESPVKCFVLWREQKLYVLWFNLFDDSERIIPMVWKSGVVK